MKRQGTQFYHVYTLNNKTYQGFLENLKNKPVIPFSPPKLYKYTLIIYKKGTCQLSIP